MKRDGVAPAMSAESLELGRGVDLVGHDASDGLLNVLHPLDHLGLTHDVHVLDERVVLLPERHLGAGGVSGAASSTSEQPG